MNGIFDVKYDKIRIRCPFGGDGKLKATYSNVGSETRFTNQSNVG